MAEVFRFGAFRLEIDQIRAVVLKTLPDGETRKQIVWPYEQTTYAGDGRSIDEDLHFDFVGQRVRVTKAGVISVFYITSNGRRAAWSIQAAPTPRKDAEDCLPVSKRNSTTDPSTGILQDTLIENTTASTTASLIASPKPSAIIILHATTSSFASLGQRYGHPHFESDSKEVHFIPHDEPSLHRVLSLEEPIGAPAAPSKMTTKFEHDIKGVSDIHLNCPIRGELVFHVITKLGAGEGTPEEIKHNQKHILAFVRGLKDVLAEHE